MTAYQRKCVALLERIAAALEAGAAAAAASQRAYSDSPAARRMRRMRARRREQSVTRVTLTPHRSEENPGEQSVTSVTPRLPSSSSLRSEEKQKLGATTRVPKFFLRQVYCEFAAAHRACTGGTWYEHGAVPPEEIHHAIRLHHLVGGQFKAAHLAIARFRRLWRDDQFTRRLGFTFRALCWSMGKIQERRGSLRLVAPAKSPPRRRPGTEAPPPPRYDVPKTRAGSAQVREVLAHFARNGAPGLKH